jgi:hypothetical protein
MPGAVLSINEMVRKNWHAQLLKAQDGHTSLFGKVLQRPAALLRRRHCQQREWIDRAGKTVHPVVQMRRCGSRIASVADIAEYAARLNALAGGQWRKMIQMGVVMPLAAGTKNPQDVAAKPVMPAPQHDPLSGCMHWRSPFGKDIDSFMATAARSGRMPSITQGGRFQGTDRLFQRDWNRHRRQLRCIQHALQERQRNTEQRAPQHGEKENANDLEHRLLADGET